MGLLGKVSKNSREPSTLSFRILNLNLLQSGLIIRLPFVEKMNPKEYFDDVKHWDGVVPIDGDLESHD